VSEPVQLIWVPPQGPADGADTDAALSAAFTALGVPHASVTGLYGHDLSRFGTVWCSVGSFLSHHVLRPWEGRRLADHVAAGGSVYLEGGDIWTQPDPITELHAISGIAGLSPFSGTITSVAGTGQAGCDMAPFSAGYSGNSFQVDRIGPTGPDAWTIWLRNSSSDGIGVFSRPPGTGGKIIGTSWFLGGYDGDMTSLVEQYLSCLAPPGPGSDFIRSDVNGDGAFNLVDPIQVLTYLFVNGDLSCLDAADFSDDDALNIADPVGILTFLFAAGPPPPPPYPDCGADPEGTALDCGDGGCP
ncbi:MAG: hypothetical protein ACE5GW_08755, partial [Planctomycetota bacterium]